jgi:hypothetical protein
MAPFKRKSSGKTFLKSLRDELLLISPCTIDNLLVRNLIFNQMNWRLPMKNIVRTILVLVLAASIGLSFPSEIQSATVSGSVAVPDSDMGYKARVSGMKIRVEGTDVSAEIVPASSYTGNFVLTNVPSGNITLLLIENNQDVFTQSSKRVPVNVAGDTVTDVSFNLAYHWKELAGYPSPQGQAGYDEWTPHFVSDQVGFILFRIRGTGIDPERVELYRTLDGGETWAEIGHWLSGDSPYPDRVHRTYYFTDQTHGVIQALVDTNANPDVVWYSPRGVLWTSNGGNTWQYTVLPTPPDTDDITIHRFAQISPSHLIAAGTAAWSSVNADVIWESTDRGATWEIKASWQPANGCSGLGANGDGKAIAFFTPYAWGGLKKVALREATGNWTRIDDNELITNSGYGPADIPMVGDNAWLRNTNNSTQPAGLYNTRDAGLNWEMISALELPYVDFATENKGFGLAGGPAYVSYDEGETWLYQSGGGGLCCHGNNIWAFDTTHAIWHETGAGDPNGEAQLFTYVEPWEPNFEVLPGVQSKDGYVESGETNVPLASYKFLNHGPVPIRVESLAVRTSSACTYSNDISQVKLWLDRNANGYADEEDTELTQGVFSADDEALPLILSEEVILSQLVPVHLLLTYDLAGDLYPLRTFTSSLTAQDVVARRTDTNATVPASAPPNYPITGRPVTTAQKIFSDDFETGLGHWIPSSDTEPPDPGYGWQIVDTTFVSPTHSAFAREDRNHQNWITNHYLRLAEPLDLSLEGNYFLTFLHRYQLDPSFKLWVEASADDGTTWDPIGKYGSHGTWAAYSTGDFIYEILDLSDYAGVDHLLIRFRFDSSAGSGSYGDWFLDDINVFHRLVPKSVTLFSPAGGEVIPSASTHVIEWEAPPEAETFKLLYSIDHGTTWKLIKDGVRGNSYCWQVPRTRANKKGCLVKVIGYDGSGKKVGSDISNSLFTIEVVKILHPNGGEVLHAGESKTIQWRASPEADHFDLTYSLDNGTTWTVTQNGRAVKGASLPFEVPAPATGNKTKCLVKIVAFSEAGAKAGSDLSDKPFSIEVVKLTSPNGGPPALKPKDLVPITWTIYDTSKPIATVQLSYTTDGGTTWTSIKPPPSGPFSPGQHTYPWLVPQVSSTRCKVKVVLKDSGGVVRGSDASDSLFTIER